MTEQDSPGIGEPIPTLAQLISARMRERGWSYTDLARASGGELTRGRWQQLGSGVPQRKFPEPASLLVIARVLEIDITAVVFAAAQSLGLNMTRPGSGLSHLLPAGTDKLAPRMRDAILALIRAAVSDTTDGRAEPDLDDASGLVLEWPKSAAPSRHPQDQTTRDVGAQTTEDNGA